MTLWKQPGLLASLFCLASATAAASACPTTLVWMAAGGGDPLYSSAVLRPEDQTIAFRTTMLTEKWLRKNANASEAPWRPLSPREAEGNCGNAVDLMLYLLKLQGVPDAEIRIVESNRIHKLAYGHVLLVWRTKTPSGEPIVVLLDPTFPQTETLAFVLRRSIFVASPETPGKALNATPEGQEILAQIRQGGFWIPTAAGYARWASALLHGTQGGGPRDREVSVLPWAAFFGAMKPDFGTHGSADEVLWFARRNGFPNATEDNLPTIVRGELDRIDAGEVALRRQHGRN